MVDDTQLRNEEPPPESARLEQLLVQALDCLEAEGAAGVEQLIAEHPQFAARLRSHLARLGHLGLVDRGSTAARGPAAASFPESLGEFRLLARLGGGGMGVVYLAEQRSLARLVALKLIRPEHLYFAGARERFQREVESVARLQHPGIVPVHATGEDSGVPWLAMEHIVGASLDEVLLQLEGRDPAKLRGSDLRAAILESMRVRAGERQPTVASDDSSAAAQVMFAGSWATVCLRIARAVAEALDHAHQRRVLHRDVKPSNIMLTPDGRALLLDFGLARTDSSVRLTGSGAQLGTPAYMSPEQARGDAAIDVRTDVYSLGVTLYELLTLFSPFISDSHATTRALVLAGRVEPMRLYNAALPRDAELVCKKAMDLDPARRYPDAAALAEDIGRVLELRPVVAQAPGPLLVARRWAQRHPARAIAIAAVFLLCFVAPSVFWMQQRTANVQIRQALANASRDRDRAREAVDVMLTRVAEEELLNVPRMQRVRRDLLASARSFYEQFLADSGNALDVAEQTAQSTLRLAGLDYELGQPKSALANADRAVQLARDVAARDPSNRALQQMLAKALDLRGKCRSAQGDLEGALGDMEQAAAILGAITAAAPADVHTAVLWLGTELARAVLLSQLGRTELAVASYRSLTETGHDLLERTVGTPRWADAFERALCAAANEAGYLQKCGQVAEVEAVLQRAEEWTADVDFDQMGESARVAKARLLQVRARLPSADPATKEQMLLAALAEVAGVLQASPEHSQVLGVEANLLQDLGLLVCEIPGRQGEARAVYARSIAQQRRLLALDPSTIELVAALAASLVNLAAMQQDAGELSAALAAFIEAEALAQTACDAVPSRPDFRRFLYNAIWFRGQVHGSLGEHAETAAAAGRLAALQPDDARTQRIAAGLLVHAAGLVAVDSGLAGSERSSRGAQLQAAAMGHLQTAARLGCTDIDHLRGVPFEPLRGVVGFAEVVAAVAENARQANLGQDGSKDR